MRAKTRALISEISLPTKGFPYSSLARRMSKSNWLDKFSEHLRKFKPDIDGSKIDWSQASKMHKADMHYADAARKYVDKHHGGIDKYAKIAMHRRHEVPKAKIIMYRKNLQGPVRKRKKAISEGFSKRVGAVVVTRIAGQTKTLQRGAWMQVFERWVKKFAPGHYRNIDWNKVNDIHREGLSPRDAAKKYADMVNPMNEANAPDHTHKIIGAFTHNGKRFDYGKADDAWARRFGLSHCVYFTGGVTRFANVKQSVAYIAVDENEIGAPVLERWAITKHTKFTTEAVITGPTPQSHAAKAEKKRKRVIKAVAMTVGGLVGLGIATTVGGAGSFAVGESFNGVEDDVNTDAKSSQARKSGLSKKTKRVKDAAVGGTSEPQKKTEKPQSGSKSPEEQAALEADEDSIINRDVSKKKTAGNEVDEIDRVEGNISTEKVDTQDDEDNETDANPSVVDLGKNTENIKGPKEAVGELKDEAEDEEKQEAALRGEAPPENEGEEDDSDDILPMKGEEEEESEESSEEEEQNPARAGLSKVAQKVKDIYNKKRGVTKSADAEEGDENEEEIPAEDGEEGDETQRRSARSTDGDVPTDENGEEIEDEESEEESIEDEPMGPSELINFKPSMKPLTTQANGL
jgi:hypothetical protein